MRISPQMIQEGWTNNEDGVWVAPSKATKKALAARRERVNLVEARQEVGSDNRRDDSPTGSTKKEVENAQLHAYQRVGLSRAEAIRAVELGNGKARFNKR